MKVRSKLALATGFGLLLLLAAFYIGGRWVMVATFRHAEQQLLRALPDLRRSLRVEMDNIAAIAREQAATLDEDAVWEAPPAGGPPPTLSDAAMLGRHGLHLYVLIDSEHRILKSFWRSPEDPDNLGIPDASVASYLRPGSRLLGTNGTSGVNSGILSLKEGPVMVVAEPVRRRGGTNDMPLGTLLLGRSLSDAQTVLRIASGFGSLSLFDSSHPLKMQVEPLTNGFVQAKDMFKETIELALPDLWGTRPSLRARVPLYDVNGKPVCAFQLRLNRSLRDVSELALAWFALLVAITGGLFVLPVFLMQSHTVLNPLTRLAEALRNIQDEIPHVRRLGWRRKDEFGLVARTIDGMLDALEHERREVLESNERIKALLTANPDTIFAFDRNGNILDVVTPRDGRMELLFSSRMEGCNIRQVSGVKTEVAERIVELVREAIDTHRIQIYEYNMKRPSGSLFWAETRIVRMSEERALVIVRDITARRSAQQERARLEEKMARIQKVESLGVLAGGIAHDYNNILAAMLGHVELALEERLSPSGREAIESIRQAMLRAAALTRQMLAFAGQGPFQFQLTNINRLLRDLVRLMRGSISRQVLVNLDLAPDLPLGRVDNTQIWQVAMNLLVNASDALAGSVGTITLKTAHVKPAKAELDAFLSVTPLKVDDYIEISVSDTGNGMDARTIERIFDPFFSTKAVGRGLGLSAVLGIVRAHNGSIAVSSKPGGGTTFRLLLPAARNKEGQLLFEMPEDSGEAGKQAEPQFIKEVPVGRHAKGLVLVADDEPAVLHLIGMVLKNAGYRVLAAANGEELLSHLERHQDEVVAVLIDLMLPDMNGMQIVDAVHARVPDLPAIIMSGYGDAQARIKGSGRVISDYLAKPFSSAELIAIVAKALKSKDKKFTGKE